MFSWLKIKDPLIRKAFSELFEKLKNAGGGKEVEEVKAQVAAAQANYQTLLRQLASTEAALDGKITTYWQPDPPNGEDIAEGDLWFDTDDKNKVYRYTNGQWIEARDQGIDEALQAAQTAQAIADGKITTYWQPSQPSSASEGDLWFDTDDKNKAYIYQNGQWVLARDQGIDEAIQKATTAQATADGKITTFWQDSAPTSGMSEGDLWFDTNDGNKAYIYHNGSWVLARDQGIDEAIQRAVTAQATADGKIVTFFQPNPPTAKAVGDLWIDTDDNNKIYRWDGSAWVNISDDLISQAVYTFQDLQNDLRRGVSVVFKGTSNFDQSYPSAIAIGNIQLNPDGTVEYGSRGVAITKNGIAGFDDSYNGSGDLPSFTIDTNGNVYLRGEVHAESGSFAGELLAPNGTFGIITAGVLRNSSGSNYVNLNADGTARFIQLNYNDFITSDGRVKLGGGALKLDNKKLELLVEEDSPNLITNPDFRQNTSCWSWYRTSSLDRVFYTSTPDSDNCPTPYAGRVRNDSTSDRAYAYCGRYDCSSGEDFTLVGYAVADSSIDYNCYLFIAFYDSNDSYISETQSVHQIPRSWTRIAVHAKAPSNAAYVRAFFAMDKNANNVSGYYYFTNMQLKRTRWGDDRVVIRGGDIEFYKTGEDAPYKTVKKVEVGVAKNGDIVTLRGFYDRRPYIIVTPKDLKSFDSAYKDQSQNIEFFPYNLQGSGDSGEWSFKVVARSKIAAGYSDIFVSSDLPCADSYTHESAFVLAVHTSKKFLWTADTVSTFRIIFQIDQVSGVYKNGSRIYNKTISVYYRIYKNANIIQNWTFVGDNPSGVYIETGDINCAVNDSFYIQFKLVFNAGSSGTNYNCVVVVSQQYGQELRYVFTLGNLLVRVNRGSAEHLADGYLNWIAIG